MDFGFWVDRWSVFACFWNSDLRDEPAVDLFAFLRVVNGLKRDSRAWSSELVLIDFTGQ